MNRLIEKKVSELCKGEHNIGMGISYSQAVLSFLKEYPALSCLSFSSLHLILVQKNKKVQAGIIEKILELINNPIISNYRVREIIKEAKREINCD